MKFRINPRIFHFYIVSVCLNTIVTFILFFMAHHSDTSLVATEGCPLLQPQVAVYYESLRSVSGRPPVRDALGNAPWNALRMVGVGCESDTETRGIDVTRRAESIGEGIRV